MSRARPACPSPLSRWCLGGSCARCGIDPRARLGRDDGTRLHLSSRRGDLARRQIRRPRHGHQRPVEPLLTSNWRSASSRPARAGRSSPSSPTPPRIRSVSCRSSGRCASTARPGWCYAPAIGTSLGELKALVAGLPVVQVMRRLPGLKASLVSPENRDGARKATAHLIATGHKQIAFVGGLTSMIVREERLAGYRLALEEAGIPLDSSLVIETVINYRAAGRRPRSCSTSTSPRPPPSVSTTSSRSALFAR